MDLFELVINTVTPAIKDRLYSTIDCCIFSQGPTPSITTAVVMDAIAIAVGMLNLETLEAFLFDKLHAMKMESHSMVASLFSDSYSNSFVLLYWILHYLHKFQ